MLILRRKKNESLLIGDNIRITIIECAGDGVRLAIDAPKQVSILREELSEAEQSNKNALTPDMNSIRMFQSIFKKRTETDAEAADAGPEGQSGDPAPVQSASPLQVTGHPACTPAE